MCIFNEPLKIGGQAPNRNVAERRMETSGFEPLIFRMQNESFTFLSYAPTVKNRTTDKSSYSSSRFLYGYFVTTCSKLMLSVLDKKESDRVKRFLY